MYINTHCNHSQPTLIKLYNKNIGGHLTPLHPRQIHLDHLSQHNRRGTGTAGFTQDKYTSTTCHSTTDVEQERLGSPTTNTPRPSVTAQPTWNRDSWVHPRQIHLDHLSQHNQRGTGTAGFTHDKYTSTTCHSTTVQLLMLSHITAISTTISSIFSYFQTSSHKNDLPKN